MNERARDELIEGMVDDVVLSFGLRDEAAMLATTTRLTDVLAQLSKRELVRLSLALIAKVAGERDGAGSGPGRS